MVLLALEKDGHFEHALLHQAPRGLERNRAVFEGWIQTVSSRRPESLRPVAGQHKTGKLPLLSGRRQRDLQAGAGTGRSRELWAGRGGKIVSRQKRLPAIE